MGYRENFFFIPADEVTIEDSRGHIIQARSLSFFLELLYDFEGLEYKLLEMDVEDAEYLIRQLVTKFVQEEIKYSSMEKGFFGLIDWLSNIYTLQKCWVGNKFQNPTDFTASVQMVNDLKESIDSFLEFKRPQFPTDYFQLFSWVTAVDTPERKEMLRIYEASGFQIEDYINTDGVPCALISQFVDRSGFKKS